MNNHNGEVLTAFGDNLMPLSQFDVSVCSAGTAEILSQTWLGRLAMPIPSREGVGLAIVVLGKEVVMLTSKTQAPEILFGVQLDSVGTMSLSLLVTVMLQPRLGWQSSKDTIT